MTPQAVESFNRLIAEAQVKSPEFQTRLSYWTQVRKKQPDMSWLFKELSKVLGPIRIREEIEMVRAAEQEAMTKELKSPEATKAQS